MFSDNKKGRQDSDSTSQQNRIAQGTKIVGDLTSEGGFRIDGLIEGTLKTPGKVVVGKMGSINGTLEGANADFEGKFSGKLILSGTLTLKSSAVIEGEVIVGKLSVEPGATFNASCSMKGAIKELNKGEHQKQKAEQSA
ncbi:MAG: polymer-forming cytoskeletal protein [Bacteroidia bacterium]|nr:polymer-forming cytoskeletal protein [Bacteroidia bacterium]NND10448.1 polymer-forming cytoskeletal protein [Flavobacteriaceae bacterium]MBT8309542.1 polymer-forming cytoskeletal protein [Bacteroidia bacterium]NNK27131.1 polymer-forming cytoskeletal protein [Flavobacteriaceae bacterium]NNL60005.1 polymer-forming cytoskeletal protein [Flavobacteriaceae bacterium]